MKSLIEAWDEGHREFAIALGGLPDEDLWKRPHPRLLSVGELAGHIAYWQAVWTLGDGNPKPELDQLAIQSPLIDHSFRYYTTTIDNSQNPSPAPGEEGTRQRPGEGLPPNASDVLVEVSRIHGAAKAAIAGKSKDDPHPQWGTWGNLIQYQVFHVAYHTGQAYSVRHLLGHETEDN